MPLLAPLLVLALASDGPPTYERDVRPILARRCVACHAAKKLDRVELSGGLALDSYEAALRGTAEHRVVDPGKPEASPRAARLEDPDDERRMPLMDEPLPEDQRTLIRRWIAAGAPRGEAAAAT